MSKKSSRNKPASSQATNKSMNGSSVTTKVASEPEDHPATIDVQTQSADEAQTSSPNLVPAETVLEAHKVRKSYGSVEALHDIDFKLAAGERVALIGPNGAGKTTLLQCLSGWLPMDKGEVTICGISLLREEQKARSSLVMLPDSPSFYQSLTAWDHMLMIGRFHDLVNVEAASEYLLDSLGLWAVRKNYPSTYSRGMKYKLGLALGLLINPKVILLDEPTAALDPLSAIVLWEMLDEFEESSGGAVLLSSHQVELTTPGIDRFFLMLNGYKIGDDSPKNWIKRYKLPDSATVANVFTAAINDFTRTHPDSIGKDLENR